MPTTLKGEAAFIAGRRQWGPYLAGDSGQPRRDMIEPGSVASPIRKSVGDRSRDAIVAPSSMRRAFGGTGCNTKSVLAAWIASRVPPRPAANSGLPCSAISPAAPMPASWKPARRWPARKPIKVDVDNLDTVIARLGLTLTLPLAEDGGAIAVKIGSIDDFHPDQLAENLDLFEQLRHPAAQPRQPGGLRPGRQGGAVLGRRGALPPPPRTRPRHRHRDRPQAVGFRPPDRPPGQAASAEEADADA